MFICTLTLLILTAALPISILCETEVSGNVSGEWTIEGSPYIATDNLVLSHGDVLVIGEGVEVLFEEGNILYILGRLEANGSEEDSIYFGPEVEEETWGGIRFRDADSLSFLNYCVITYGIVTAGEGHGDLASSGGNILILCGDVRIEHSRISHGQARGFGGGIAIWNSDPIIRNCLFSENSSSECGGGIEIYNSSSPTVEDCEFESNSTAWDGGGLCIEENSDPHIERCTFRNNNAAVGGGIGMNSSRALITDCDFYENTALAGGGVFISQGNNITIERCDFYNNQGGIGGGGLGVRFGASPEVRYCRFIDNQAPEGGALTVWSPPACNIHHNLFMRNSAVRGGVFSTYERYPMGNTPLHLNNCTFIDNLSQQPDSDPSIAFLHNNARLILKSCIIWGGTQPFFRDQDRITITYTNIENGFQGEGNSDENPGIFEMDSTWCMLQGDSPCVDSGEHNLPDDPDHSRNDRGWMHFPHDAWDGLETDLISMELDDEERRTATLSFCNETGFPIYASPLDNWQESDHIELIDVSEITEDSQIHGVAWTSSGYYLSGGNSGDDPNKIYHLNNDFELEDEFDQPGGIDGDGFLDLATDGVELLYGGDEEQIVEFTVDADLGDQYSDPSGFEIYSGIGADFIHSEGFGDIYYGGEEGIVAKSTIDFHERDRYQIGAPIQTIGVKLNSLALYVLTHPQPDIYILSIMFPEDGTVSPLYRMNALADHRPAGFEITQDWETGQGTLIGIYEGDGRNGDRLFVEKLYTSWLVIKPEWKLLMPGEETEWDIIFAGDQVEPGRHMDQFYLAVNGYGEGGEINTRMELEAASVANSQNEIPQNFRIEMVYPNPFNSTTTIRYELPYSGNVSLSIYSPSGQEIGVLSPNFKQPGIHTLKLSAGDLPSGLYFVRLNHTSLFKGGARGDSRVQKVILIR